MRTQPTRLPPRCSPVARTVTLAEAAPPGAAIAPTIPRLRLPPAANARRTSRGLSAPTADPARSGRRVLVVEDDELTREMLTTILQAEGYVVETAADGREALARLQNGEPPGLIVLDLLMPVMSGWEFCAAQARDPRLASIPVVVVSATEPDPREPAPPLRPAARLRKPITVEELLEAVGRC